MWCKIFIFLLYELELTWSAVIARNYTQEISPTLIEIFSSARSLQKDDQRIHYEMDQVAFIFNEESLFTIAEKNRYSTAEVNWNDYPAFLRLITPSGKTYFVTHYGVFVCNENEVNETISTNLPYITYGSLNGDMYVIRHLSGPPDMSIFHGTNKSQLDSDKGLRLISFVGVDKKRYLVVNHINNSLITEAATTQDDSRDYLEISFLMDEEVFVLTFTPDGSDLIDVVNCTASAFLTIAFPNGKIATFYQFINVGTPFVLDSANVTSLPYITFNNVDGAKYDVHFPSPDARPTIVRDKSQPRNKCVANELLNFDGLNMRRYNVDAKNEKLLDSEEINNSGNLVLSFGVANQSINSYEFEVDGDEEYDIDIRFGDNDKPTKPFDDGRMNTKCLVSCVG